MSVCEKGSNRTLGSFATATEAALCYARYTAPAASGQQGEPNAASPEKPAKRRRGDGRGALDGSVAPTIDVGQAPKWAVALPPITGVTGLLSSTVSAEQQNLNVLPHPPPQPRPPPPLPRFPPPLPLKSAAAPLGSPAAERTMAQKVARIKEELALDPSLPVAKAVATANAVMGIEPQGTLPRQVDHLLKELTLPI